MKYLLGADPELFFVDMNLKDLKSVIGLLGGDKHKPLEFTKGFGVLEDNVAAEFNIPPCRNENEWNENIKIAIDYLTKRALSLGYNLSHVASGRFKFEELDNPMAQAFGCEPDYNAYTGEQNDRPACDDPHLRSCGGHVHLGITNLSAMEKRSLVKGLDLFLGVPSVFKDTDTERRKLYGKAGCFRYKDYGLEYRTLSNFWIWEEESRRWVYQQVGKCLDFIEEFGMHEILNDEPHIINTINGSDKEVGKLLVEKYGI